MADDIKTTVDAETREPAVAEESFDVGEGTPTGEFYPMSPEELKARNKRNLFTALAVVVFIVLILSTTMLRLLQNAGSTS